MIIIELDIYVNSYYDIFNTISLDLKLPSIVIPILLLSAPILSLLISTLLLREIDIYIYTIIDSAND